VGDVDDGGVGGGEVVRGEWGSLGGEGEVVVDDGE